MSRFYVSAELQAQVLADAGHRCGYCRSDERLTGIALSTEHLVPRAVGGATVRANLWRSCRACNEHKGAQTDAVDPETGETVPLYNPRQQAWQEHLVWGEDGTIVVGRTAIGRATIHAIQLNRPLLVVARRRWIEGGWHPPDNRGDAIGPTKGERI